MNANYFTIMTVVSVAVLSGGFVSASETSASDERIESSAQMSHVFQTYLKNDRLETSSVDGVVTLTGSVEEESHRALAEATVASIPGVTSVDNQIELTAAPAAESSDSWIAAQVKYSLLYNRHVSGIKTQVFVTEGVVTLQGEAESQAQKDLAGEYAKDIKGVRDVQNEMTLAAVPGDAKQTLSEKIDDASITGQIKMALLLHHSTSAFKTGVETTDGVVTVSGIATSAAAKEMVSKVANDAHGVIKVINNMTIEEPMAKK